MPDPTQTPAAAAPVAPAATQEAPAASEAPRPVARSFKDVKIRRISEQTAREPARIEPPVDSIPRAAQPSAAGAEAGNAAGAASEAGTQGATAGETAIPDTNLERQFKALHKQKQKIRAREELFAKEKAEHDKIVADYRELAALRTNDPVGFLERVGLSIPAVNEAAKKRPQDPRTSAIERELQELKAQLAKRDEEALVAQRDALNANLRQDVHKLVSDKRDELKYLNAWDAGDEVYKTVLTFEDVHGRLPTPSDVERIAKDVDAALKTKHEAAQQRLGGAATTKAPAATAPRSLSALRSAPQAEAPRTLSRQEKLHQTAEIFRSFSKSQ